MLEVGTVVRVVFKRGEVLPYGEIGVVTCVTDALTTVRSLRSGKSALYGDPKSLELVDVQEG